VQPDPLQVHPPEAWCRQPEEFPSEQRRQEEFPSEQQELRQQVLQRELLPSCCKQPGTSSARERRE
jgi:hypothetical protein